MIVITGASDGLGKELAKVCQHGGKKVVNISRTESEFADYNFLYDLSESSGVESAAKDIGQLTEKLEAVVNCAGIMSLQDLSEVSAEEVRRVIVVNVESQILLVSRLFERIKQDGTDVINVASTVGTKGYVDQAAYGASKWAVRGFTANLQAEFKGLPNRAISFCVGGFRSNIAKKITGKDIPDPENWMDPKDIAEFMYAIIELPKNMEVSEIILNRKAS